MKRILGFCLLVGTLGLAGAAHAVPRVTITKGQVQPMPIAIMDFYADPSADGQMAQEIPQVVTADLASSGLFAPIAKSAFIQDPAAVHSAPPHFADWKSIDAQALVTGAISRAADGRTRVEFRLWDVYGGSQMAGTAYTTSGDNWRRIAHIISDEIYKRVTGEAGYFDSRIVYIAESGPANDRQKRLAIMDQDGAGVRYLTNGGDLVVTPRFSPSEQEITYMAFGGEEPKVMMMNIETGQREAVGSFPGMTFAPRFGPQGRQIVMSMSENGASNLYSMNIGSKETTRLTDDQAIDTSPSYSPDGSQICFESDRGGTQQVYVMGAGGGGAHRISFGEGRYSTPVWSPKGDFIAFTKQTKGGFAIGVMKPDGSGERLLTEGFHNEGPTWAPNGLFLMFFRDPGGGGGSKIYMTDVFGRQEFAVPTPAYASDPAWSPLLGT